MMSTSVISCVALTVIWTYFPVTEPEYVCVCMCAHCFVVQIRIMHTHTECFHSVTLTIIAELFLHWKVGPSRESEHFAVSLSPLLRRP